MPSHDRCGAVNLLTFLRMVLHVLLNLFAGESLRIKAAARWHRCCANKWLVAIDQIETRAIDPQIPTQFDVSGICAALERLIELQGLGIDLPPENIIQAARCVHEFQDHLALASSETCGVERHL